MRPRVGLDFEVADGVDDAEGLLRGVLVATCVGPCVHESASTAIINAVPRRICSMSVRPTSEREGYEAAATFLRPFGPGQFG